MALSNWDTMAFDEKGQPTNGVFKTRLGFTVGIYKNWLYIHDKRAWRKGGFTEPTIIEVQDGRLQYLDLHVVALRGPQDGVYAVCWSTFYYKQRKGRKYREPKITGLVGCGVYGWTDDGKYVGVTPSSLKWLREKLNVQHDETIEMPDGIDAFRTETYKAYDLDIPDCFRVIKLAAGKRFNQGDAFFAEHLGVDQQITKPGRAKKNHLTRMTEKLLKTTEEHEKAVAKL